MLTHGIRIGGSAVVRRYGDVTALKKRFRRFIVDRAEDIVIDSPGVSNRTVTTSHLGFSQSHPMRLRGT